MICPATYETWACEDGSGHNVTVQLYQIKALQSQIYLFVFCKSLFVYSSQSHSFINVIAFLYCVDVPVLCWKCPSKRDLPEYLDLRWPGALLRDRHRHRHRHVCPSNYHVMSRDTNMSNNGNSSKEPSISTRAYVSQLAQQIGRHSQSVHKFSVARTAHWVAHRHSSSPASKPNYQGRSHSEIFDILLYSPDTHFYYQQRKNSSEM